MKRSRGLTFIEVIIALGITSILLPVLGLVFYQVLVIPPEQSSRLSLADEVGRIASYLYRDGYMADNFSVGVFPTYGYFNWTDYSNGYQHYVRYYWTESCIDADDCEHIAREEIIVVPTPTATGTPLPTPTPTPTSEPTPTPTALPTPTPTTVPETYTYCDNWGEDKWAFGRTWSNQEWVTCSRPYNLSDYFRMGVRVPPCTGEIDSGYQMFTGNETIYDAICSVGGDYWMEYEYLTVPVPHEDSQLYVYKVYQDRDSVTNVSVKFIGRGPDAASDTIYYLKVYMWDYVNSAWVRYVNVNGPAGSASMNTYIFSNTSKPKYYIESGSGNVSILVASEYNPSHPGMGVYTDYIELQIH